MVKIYHNPRCSKSRQGVSLLEDKNIDFQVKEYLKEKLSYDELAELIDKLGIKPMELVRKNEAIWKEQYKEKALTDKEITEAMIAFPKLIERPIVVNGKKAVIGRPTEKILEVL